MTDGENWTEEEKETIAEYMDLEGMRYTPGYADDTKNRIRANAFRYAGFCLKMGLKYPSVYLDAVLAHVGLYAVGAGNLGEFSLEGH